MIEVYLEGIIQELSTSHVISSFEIIRQEAGDDEGYIRIKCFLLNEDIFEFAKYIEAHKNKILIQTYSFHWQNRKGKLIKRWDNVPHHKELGSFPYHLHFHSGEPIESKPMTLKKVLKEIEKVIPFKYDED